MGESSLPTGRVTFLFTDIEGSTKLWDAHRDAMAVAVAGHDALLRRAIAGRGGHVFKTVGDAFCAAFQRPDDALAAAVAAQEALATEAWGEVGALRVRMALHAGQAEERDADYFGPTVNRVARLLAAGHGGQILLSRTAAEALGAPPDGVELRDLGDRRLKDLTRPERVFQCLVPGLPDAFPPLNSLDARPNNLPVQPTPLLGREGDLAAVKARLRDRAVRLLTLTGPGGTGKTRLALQAAADLIDGFPHGVWFVDLSATVAPGLVAAEIAGALGIREEGGGPIEEQVLRDLRGKELLLVLDNFEQVLPAARLVGTLVAGCPKLKLLVTSRAPLRATGEREFPVDPLPVPDLRRPLDPGRLEAFPSVELFVERAAAIKPGFALSAGNARAVAEICVALDGLPLAIELAAARVRLLSPKAMLPKLEHRLKLLTGGARDRAERQRTLRAAIAWSHDLLTPEEQALFARLGVFAGGCTLEAAEAVANTDEDLDVFAGIGALVEHSLLRQEEHADGEPRFAMLATIREYAVERLAERGEGGGLRRAHAACFLALVEAAEPELAGPDQGRWLDRLEAEHDNVRTALAWSHETNDAAAVRLTAALAGFWRTRGHLSEAQAWHERVLAWGDGVGPDRRARLLNNLGNVACDRGDVARARSVYEDSLAIRRALGDEQGAADVLGNLALLAGDQGDYARARALHAESLAIRRRLGDRRRLALSLVNLGAVAHRQGDLTEAAAFLEEALAVFRELGDETRIAYALTHIGIVARHRGDLERARASFEEALTRYGAVGSKEGIAGGLTNLGNVARAEGDLDRAAELHERALARHRELGNRRGEALALGNVGATASDRGDYAGAAAAHRASLALHRALEDARGTADAIASLAHCAAKAGEPERAARLYGAAEALRQAIGAAIPLAERAEHEGAVTAVRERLGEAAFAAAWAAGRALAVEAAVAEATAASGASGGG